VRRVRVRAASRKAIPWESSHARRSSVAGAFHALQHAIAFKRKRLEFPGVPEKGFHADQEEIQLAKRCSPCLMRSSR